MSGFGRKAVIQLTGVSRAQLADWDKHGIVKPSVKTGAGKGSRREYSFKDLVQLRMAKRLRDEGVSLQKLRKTLAYLRKNFPEIKQPLAELKLLTNGTDIFVLTKDPKVILNTLTQQFVFAFAIGKIITDLTAEVRTFATARTETITVMRKRFTVTLTPDSADGGYTVTCPDVPAAVSQGESVQECLDNISDAIELVITSSATPKKAVGRK